MGQKAEIILIQLRPVVHVQRGPGEAEALELVELGLDMPVRHALDGAGQAAVLPLGAHEQELIVQRGGHVVLGVHFAAHGLGLQPDLLIAAALHQHLIRAELLQVQPGLGHGGIVELLQGGIGGMKDNACLRKHGDSPLRQS